jgi:hypothetical protein
MREEFTYFQWDFAPAQITEDGMSSLLNVIFQNCALNTVRRNFINFSAQMLILNITSKSITNKEYIKTSVIF